MLLALALLTAPAEAGGYYLPDSGIIAYGRGGAYVASAEGQFAQYYNPAGLIRTEHPTINLGLSGVQQHTSFTRLADDGTFLDPAVNEAPPFLIPQVGFVTPLGDDFALAVGFTSPFAPSSDYDPDGPQRYTIIETTIWNFSVGPSLAWRPVPQVAVGLGLQWQMLRVDQRLKVTTSGQDDHSNDVSVDARVWDHFTPSFNAGVIVEPIEELSIGLSVQPPARFRGKGEGELDFTGHVLFEQGMIDKAVWRDDDITLNIQLPLVLRGGLAGRPVPGLEIEGAVVYERWSALSDIVVEDIDVTITGDFVEEQVEDSISLPAGFRDVVSFRLGAAYEVHPQLALRAGGFYETASLGPQEVNVAVMDTPKIQVGGGLSFWPVPAARIDLSAAYLFFQDAQVRDSSLRQINVYGGDEKVVGNGDYSASGWMVGGQVSWAFGAGS